MRLVSLFIGVSWPKLPEDCFLLFCLLIYSLLINTISGKKINHSLFNSHMLELLLFYLVYYLFLYLCLDMMMLSTGGLTFNACWRYLSSLICLVIKTVNVKVFIKIKKDSMILQFKFMSHSLYSCSKIGHLFILLIILF